MGNVGLYIWEISRGAYFGDVLDPAIHQLPMTWHPPTPIQNWSPYIAVDWGSSAPAVCQIFLRAPGDIPGICPGTLIILDELSSALPNDFNVGQGWPPAQLAQEIKDMCSRWGCPTTGVMDDAYGIEDSLINFMRKYQIYVNKPNKKRIFGWQKMRQMLHSQKIRDGKPGLLICARAQYFWQTVPFLTRNPLKPEDIISTGVPDHSADCCRYGCTIERVSSSTHVIG